MFVRVFVLLSVACVARCAPPPLKSLHEKVIYGTDNRVDVCESESSLFQDIARHSICAIISDTTVGSPSNGTYNHNLEHYRPLGAKRNLCSDQKFRSHPTAASCSATLIARDRVLTAGHCISSYNCGRRKFVFNYVYDGDDCSMPTISSDDVYGCVRFERMETGGWDHAIVHLDRPVSSDKKPVQVRTDSQPLDKSSRVTVIGFGSGVPAKIDRGGYVIDPRPSQLDYFVASTDTFGGNSGSGAFDDSGRLVGVLVRGQTDYVYTSGCRRVNVIGCSNEQCSKLSEAEELSYPYRGMEDAVDCEQDSDCSGSKSCLVKTCEDCTGWCQ